MDMQTVGTEVFNFAKTSYMTALGTMTVIQDQTERTLNTLVQQGAVLQEEGKKILNDWTNHARKNRQEYQRMFEESLKRVESFFQKNTTK